MSLLSRGSGISRARTGIRASRFVWLAQAVLTAFVLVVLAACSSSNASHLGYVAEGTGISAFRINNHSGASTAIFTSPFIVGNSPAGMVMHPSNQFAFVSNQGDNTISLLKVDSTSGSLTEVLPRTNAGLAPGPMIMDTTGKFLFVANQGSNDISVFSVSSNGALQLLSTTPVGSSPTSLAMPTSGSFLYVSVPTFSAVYGFSVSSGNLTAVPNSPFQVANGVSTVAVAPAGNFLYVPNPATNTISGFAIQSSGALTQLSSSPFAVICAGSSSCTPVGAGVDPTGKYLYGANYNGTAVSQFTIDGSTGALTSITTTSPVAGTHPEFIVFDPGGTFVFVANVGSNSITEFQIKSDGSLSTSTNTIQVGTVPRALALTR